MHYVIINPHAGKGTGSSCAPLIEAFLIELGQPYEIVFSQYPGHPMLLAQGATHYERIWAVGGDGTISEVASALVGTNAALCIIPIGTGNDFIKVAGIPTQLQSALRCAVGDTHKIDIGRVNGQYFINIAGMGFDADVAAGVSVFTKRGLSGIIAYMMSLFSTMRTFDTRLMHIVADDVQYQVNGIMVDVANGRYIGGGIKICPLSELDDNYLDVCIIKDVHKFFLPFLLPIVVLGKHTQLLKRYCIYLKVKHVSITTQELLNIQVDGNTSCAKHCTFDIVPKGLRIAAPQPLG